MVRATSTIRAPNAIRCMIAITAINGPVRARPRRCHTKPAGRCLRKPSRRAWGLADFQDLVGQHQRIEWSPVSGAYVSLANDQGPVGALQYKVLSLPFEVRELVVTPFRSRAARGAPFTFAGAELNSTDLA